MATTVLIVKCGSASPAVRVAHGDYDRWFLRALAPAGVRLRILEVHAGASLPREGGRADAIVVTGSPHSVVERAPWMLAAGTWLLERAERGTPVLGVCFGHQLLAEAFGGAVAPNPGGREIGTVRCDLTPAGEADPLFDGVPARFEVQATHADEVRRLPPGSELLATNAASRVQAFRIGRRIRAVQFHPELDAAGMSAVARARGGEGDAQARAALAGIGATPSGARILRNFVERCG